MRSLASDFEYMKFIGIRTSTKKSLDCNSNRDLSLPLYTNVYEAIMEDTRNGDWENALVGHRLQRLQIQSGPTAQYPCSECLCTTLPSVYVDRYVEWNLNFLQNTVPEVDLGVAKLLWPGLTRSTRGFLNARRQSLWLMMRFFFMRQGVGRTPVPLLSESGHRRHAEMVLRQWEADDPSLSNWSSIYEPPPRNGFPQEQMPSLQADTGDWLEYLHGLYPTKPTNVRTLVAKLLFAARCRLKLNRHARSASTSD